MKYLAIALLALAAVVTADHHFAEAEVDPVHKGLAYPFGNAGFPYYGYPYYGYGYGYPYDYYNYPYGYGYYPYGVAAVPYYQVARYEYLGEYKDKCLADGFYLRDAESFVICSNGNAFVQRCAPGSRSSGVGKLVNGKFYSQTDFCDVNLVDQGYGAAY